MLSVRLDSDDQLFAYIDNKKIYLSKLKDNEQLIDYKYKKVNYDGADYYILKLETSAYYSKIEMFVVKSSYAVLSCTFLCHQDLYNANIRFVCKGNILLLEDDKYISGVSFVNNYKIGRSFFHDKDFCNVYLSDNFILFIQIDDETSGQLFSCDGTNDVVTLAYYDDNIIIAGTVCPFCIVNACNDYLKIKYVKKVDYPSSPYSIDITSVMDTTFICLHHFKECLLFYEINNDFICYEHSCFGQYGGIHIVYNGHVNKLIFYNSTEYKILSIDESILYDGAYDGIVALYHENEYSPAYGLQIDNIDNKIVITYIPLNDNNFNDIVLLKSMIKCAHDVSDDEGFKEAYKLLATFGGLMDSKYILE